MIAGPNETRTIQVDLFTSFELGYRRFAVEATVYHKPDVGRDFLPSLPVLLTDKVRTVHVRQGRDARDKQAKDLLDIHRLVFHNKAGMPSPDLLRQVPLSDRRQAAHGRIERAKNDHPGFADDYDEIAQWLERP